MVLFLVNNFQIAVFPVIFSHEGDGLNFLSCFINGGFSFDANNIIGILHMIIKISVALVVSFNIIVYIFILVTVFSIGLHCFMRCPGTFRS